jgi:hypothetical protein
MLEEQQWGLAILVSQKLAWPFQNPLGVWCFGRTSKEALTWQNVNPVTKVV